MRMNYKIQRNYQPVESNHSKSRPLAMPESISTVSGRDYIPVMRTSVSRPDRSVTCCDPTRKQSVNYTKK